MTNTDPATPRSSPPTEHAGEAEKPPAGARRRPSATQAVSVVGGLIAAAAALAGLVDWIQGRLDSPPPKPPPVIDASVEQAVVHSTSEPLGSYLRDAGESTEGLTRRERREPGVLFSVRVRLRGNQGEPLTLVWRMYDDTSDRPVPGARYRRPAASFEPQNEDHAATVPIWAPHPPRAGTYFVRFMLVDKERRPVGEARTKPFVLTRVSSG